jgi:hypothetical protein
MVVLIYIIPKIKLAVDVFTIGISAIATFPNGKFIDLNIFNRFGFASVPVQAVYLQSTTTRHRGHYRQRRAQFVVTLALAWLKFQNIPRASASSFGINGIGFTFCTLA